MSSPQASVASWLEDTRGWSRVEFVSALSGGNSNVTWLFRGADSACVVRTTPAEAISPNSARGIERESRVLDLVQGKVKAPKLHAWCDDLSVMGRPFLVQEWIAGKSLTDTLPETYGDPVASANALGEDLMVQLAAIHAIEWPAAGLESLGKPDNFVARQIDRWLKVRADQAVRDLPQLFEIGDWLNKNRPETLQPALIHGDYHLDNTLADLAEPKINAIIDWELATVGDPAMDVALALLFWGDKRCSEPPAFQHLQAVSRLPGVVDRRSLAALWAERTGRSSDHMGYYIALASWRLAAIIEGAYCLYVDGKVATDYAAGLEHDVPALLTEAARAAQGDW